MIAATILVIPYPFAFPEMIYRIITPIPVTAKTAFLAIDNFIFPSSVHQLFCGNMHITILTTADIHTTASTIVGIIISGNVNFQTYIKII